MWVWQKLERDLFMPTEKSFNVDEAIENAMLLFWKKGYKNTSISDLLDSTGLNRGSFYNAFGSKRNLFILTLMKYDRESRVELDELTLIGSPTKAIEVFFHCLIDKTVSDPDKKGCFTVNTLINITSYDDEIQKIARDSFHSVETFFKQMIKLGHVRGEISKDVSAEKTAISLASLMVSIRVLGRGTYDQKQLKILLNQVLNLIY